MYATLTSVVPGMYAIGPGINFPISITGIQSLTPCATTGFPACGVYTLSSSANGTVGSIGSPIAITLTGIGDGGATNPGPALTVKDLGPGVTFPTTSRSCTSFGNCTGTGSVPVSGTFDTSVLGGMPTTIQAQISATSNGPALAGCSACAWTNLTGYSATLSSGTIWNWSGTVANVPAGWGPLFVSVCASNATPACTTNNGTAYATMPSLFSMGLTFDMMGVGQSLPLISAIGGLAVNYYQGNFGSAGPQANGGNAAISQWDQGPDVGGTNFFPGSVALHIDDRFAMDGVLGEGGVDFTQLLTNAFGGWPTSFSTRIRDGVSTILEVIGDQNQIQSIGLGNGTATVVCSATKYCGGSSGIVSNSGPVFYTTAELGGATLAGASISGTTLSIPATTGLPISAGIQRGGLEPGEVLTDTTGSITGAPTLVNCLTGCALGSVTAAQTWTISSSQTVSAETMRADPPAGAPVPMNYIAQAGLGAQNSGSFGGTIIGAGTFKFMVNGVVVCSDTTPFTYNNQGGNCTDPGSGVVSAGFVNYQTGDFQVNFVTAPANNAVLTASFTNLMTPDPTAAGSLARPQGLDWIGDGTFGTASAILSKNPGGVSGHILGGGQLDRGYFTNANVGYALGSPGYTQQVSWTYDTKFPAIIPGQLSSVPPIESNFWRAEGANNFSDANQTFTTFQFEQWVYDFTSPSTFNGTISGSTLTLTSGVTGYTPWEGMILGCNPFSLGCQVAQGTYITALTSGTWGASGSTYSLNRAGCLSTCTALALENANQYQGPAVAIEAGPNNDISVQQGPPPQTGAAPDISPHGTNGTAGLGRIGRRMACNIWGGLTNTNPVPAPNCSDPTLDRVKADAVGCDSAALAAPCNDIGNTFAAIHSGAISGSKVTFTGGLSANARPFVVGMALSCSGCTTGRFITAVSLPPTQDTRAGQGQIGQTFTITANGSLGVAVTETVTGGCSGTSGTGSNCVDIAFKLNTTGATALATCGENNLNGTAPVGQPAAGPCQDNGLGELVKGFRIGTNQATGGEIANTVYDDGADPGTTSGAGGGFVREF